MLWLKTFHIIFITSWFAGLFYLPRIYVNLALETDPAAKQRLIVMARKLLRFMTMLVVPALGLGLALWYKLGMGPYQGWLHAKAMIALLLLAYHLACARWLRGFESGSNTHTHRYYRIVNELPVLGLCAGVFFAVMKPL